MVGGWGETESGIYKKSIFITVLFVIVMMMMFTSVITSNSSNLLFSYSTLRHRAVAMWKELSIEVD